jgi:hypothetical protein
MNDLGLRGPLFLALRRLRARPFAALGLTLALAGAAGLIGWSSLTAALSQEDSVRRQLVERSSGAPSVQVLYYTLPLENDFRAPTVNDAFAGLAPFTTRARRVQISHSIEPGDPLGTRIAVAREPRADVVVRTGRLPTGCSADVCETLALKGGSVGDRLALGNEMRAVVVGVGSLRRELLPDPSQLAQQTLLLRSLPKTLRQLVLAHGSTVVVSAELDPHEVRGYRLDEVRARLRVAITRLERGDPLVRASAPLALLGDLSRRGKVARERLLLVAGEGAALVVAFAAFLAAARRRETELMDDQLSVLGASRAQVWTARTAEVAAPCVAGTALALVALFAAAAAAAASRGLPLGFVRAGLPLETVLVIGGVAVLSALLLVAARAPASARRFGALELAALTALAVVAWEAATTGALDPDRVAVSGAGPLLLLVPALAFFAVGVLLLRLLPLALRAGARATRRAPFAVKLAFLTAARNPAQVAAATTFLAIALGAALFSLDYRATLDAQSQDQASFAVGAEWRIAERGRHGSQDVTPLTRFARISSERPTPVLRLDGTVEEPAATGAQVAVTVLAMPARRIPDVRGWRTSFSPASRDDISARLRPQPVHLAGPALARDARELRVWTRAQTDYPRRLVLHLLLPGQGFAHVSLGIISTRWRLLRFRVRPALRRAQLIGVSFEPTYVPISFKYEPKGLVELGPLEQRAGGDWRRLPSLAPWITSTAPTGTAGVLNGAAFEHAPVTKGIRYELLGTFQPFVHPGFGLPAARPGFVTGDIPAVAGGAVAGRAVDGLLILDLEGIQVPVRVVGSARLFPTVVERPSNFLLFDYDTLFAALNADQPGLVVPSEAWFFRAQRVSFAGALLRNPFRPKAVLGARRLAHALEADPLAAGMRDVLGVTGIAAAALGLLGLALATRSALGSERLQLAEYEALGVPPRSLRRSAQVRLFALSAFGIVAGLLGAFLSGRLISAFVSITGTARRPLPPIVSVVWWPAVVAVVVALGLAGIAAAALLTRRALRDAPAGRLRA